MALTLRSATIIWLGRSCTLGIATRPVRGGVPNSAETNSPRGRNPTTVSRRLIITTAAVTPRSKCAEISGWEGPQGAIRLNVHVAHGGGRASSFTQAEQNVLLRIP